jgi:hypothetical protein
VFEPIDWGELTMPRVFEGLTMAERFRYPKTRAEYRRMLLTAILERAQSGDLDGPSGRPKYHRNRYAGIIAKCVKGGPTAEELSLCEAIAAALQAAEQRPAKAPQSIRVVTRSTIPPCR